MNKIKKTFKDFFHGLDKVLTYSLKEIDLIKSQRISIALMLLYPVLAVAALAFALSGVSVTDISFGETGLSSIELGVVLPLESDFFDLIFFRNELNSIEYLKVTEFNSKEELSNAIKRGNVSLGAIIIPPESDKSFIEIIFLHDDSSIVASSTFLAQARNAVNSIGFKKSSEILNNLISELDSITSNISGQVNKTDSLILQLESGNKQLIDLNESIHSIDTNQITSRLSLFDSYYEQSKADINVTLQDIGRMRESVSSYKENALLVQGQINNVLNPFQSDLNLLNSIASESDEPQRTALLLLHKDLNNSFNEIRNASIGVNKVVSDLNEMEFKLASAEAKLFQANERLDFAKQEINEFSSELSKVSILIEQAKELVASTFESKSIVVSELQNAKITFNELIKSLNLLKDFSPEFVVNPFKLEVEPVYGISKINAMIPLSIGLILLLTTLLLASSSVIIEREKGIYFRLKSSPTKHSTWIAGKILGQLFFALIESIIVLLVAVFLFSVSLPMNSIDLFIALTLISFSFICIGLFIPEIMKNQSTAILASLLILIPMLFLSGMIFPIEFMPSPVNLFASILPLTLANTILSSIIIKSVPITELSIELGFLLIPAMLLLLVVLIKNRK